MRRPGRRDGAQGTASRQSRLTIVLDPRFPGGTATAVAEEVRALHGVVDLEVVGIETGMFAGSDINPRLEAALEAAGLELAWNPPVIRGDVVVVHNPACLKFERALPSRISCAALYVVAHENFLRPNGAEGFDVGSCLSLLADAAVTGRRVLAPVSAFNRRGVEAWLRAAGTPAWDIAPFDWPSACDLAIRPPVAAPRDRRGRHSRPGLEKFPPLDVMRAHFPAHAEACTILGADGFLMEPSTLPRHWRALPFGAVEVERFLEGIDFFVYFTHPLWRESFGRAIVEATAAGKLVITDPGTAAPFGPGVVASNGSDVDAIIGRYVAAPELYARSVRMAQARLATFSAAAARERILRDVLGGGAPAGAAGLRPPAPEERHAVL